MTRRPLRRRAPRALAANALALAAIALAVLVAACRGGGPLDASPPPPGPDTTPVGPMQTATVIRVVDGDTIVIDRGSGEERLRYIGIDAPESVKPESPVEFMGIEAAAANEALVGGREVALEKDVSETDQYGRLLRYVWVREAGEWTMVNLELVRRGYAQVVSFPPDVRHLDELRDAQRAAREAGRGLWAEDAGSVTP